MAHLLPVGYAGQAKIMPRRLSVSSAAMLLNQPALAASASVGSLTSGGLSLRNPNAIYVGMLNSRPVADEVIKRFNLQTAYHAKDMTAARLKLARNTEVASEKEGCISISITDSDKKRSAQIANAYIDALRELTQSLSASEAAGRKFFYDEQLRRQKTRWSSRSSLSSAFSRRVDWFNWTRRLRALLNNSRRSAHRSPPDRCSCNRSARIRPNETLMCSLPSARSRRSKPRNRASKRAHSGQTGVTLVCATFRRWIRLRARRA